MPMTIAPSRANARGRIAGLIAGRTSRPAFLIDAMSSLVSTWGLDSFDPASFGFLSGAKSDADVSISAASPILTSPNAPWTAGDVGKSIDVQGAGPAGGTLSTTIAGFSSPGQITLAANAVTGVVASSSSTSGLAVWGTLAPVSVPVNPLTDPTGATIYEPSDQNVTTAALIVPGTTSSRTLGQRFGDLLSVNVKDFGAVGDGVADETAAFSAAITRSASIGASVRVPSGTYKIGQITIPNGCKGIIGDGIESTLLRTSGAFTAYQPWIYFGSVSGCGMRNLTVDAPIATNPDNHALYVDNCSYFDVTGVRIRGGGFIGVYISGGSDIACRDVDVLFFTSSAIRTEYNAQRVSIVGCNSMSSPTVGGHAIVLSGGANHLVSECYVNGATFGSFCIAVGDATDVVIAGNRVVASFHEGIQLTHCSRCVIASNTIQCAAGHVDFGISIDATSSYSDQNMIVGNRISNSGGPGIGIAGGASFGTRYTYVCDNLIDSPVQYGSVPAGLKAGIGIYGLNTAANVVAGNRCGDQGSNMLYGVCEYNNGDGSPNYNRIHQNFTSGSGLVADTLTLGALTQVDEQRPRTTTAGAVTSGSGSITASTNSVRYVRHFDRVEFWADITVSNNGTGGGSLILTLPVSAAVTSSACHGRNETTKKGLIGVITASSLELTYSDGTYPIATGQTVRVSGSYPV